MQKILVALMAGSSERCNSLAALVDETQLASPVALTESYCATEDDFPAQRILQAKPDIVLIDLEKSGAAVRSVAVLHSVLPQTWLFACGPSNCPQLIIEAMQAGARDYLPTPVAAPALATAFSRCIDERRRLRSDVKSRGRVYSITAAKGGTGATSVTVGIAATLSRAPDRRVAILDLTIPLGDAAGYLNLEPKFSLAGAMDSAASLDPASLATFMEKTGGLSVLSGPGRLKASPASVAALTKLISVAVASYTDIFIDVPSTLDPALSQVLFDASAAVLVVTTPELLAVARTHHLLNSLAGQRCGDRLRLILNRDDHRDDFDAKGISRVLGHSIYWKLPNDYRAATQAISQGKPIGDLINSVLAASYQGLTKELTGFVARKQRRRILKFAWAKSPRAQSRRFVPIA